MRLDRFALISRAAVVVLILGSAALVHTQAPYEFEISPGVRGVLADSSLKELRIALEPLRAATSILQTSPRAEPEQLAHALDLSRKALDSIESRSLTIQTDEPLSLFWTNVLSDAWFVTGWAALESADQVSAESYLRASWWVSRDKSSGLELARVLEAKGDQSGATHLLELASVTPLDNPMGLMGSSFPTNSDIAEKYGQLTGRSLPDSREQLKALGDELTLQNSISSLVHSTKLDGNAVFLISLRAGERHKAKWYLNDGSLAPAASALEAHTFETFFPIGSKAALLREVYVSCAPANGCSAYLHPPTDLDFPGSRVNWKVFYPSSPIPFKTANIRLE